MVGTPHILGRDVNLVAKYLFDVEHRNRFNSSFLILSVVMGF